MPPPIFLSLEQVLEIHADQIERYGGSLGVRDMGLLESALAMPQAGFGGEYFHAGIYEMAAAYLYHIVRNHPFLDGNKRVGTMAAFVFLKMNRVALRAPEGAFEKMVLNIAGGGGSKAILAEFIRRYAGPDSV